MRKPIKALRFIAKTKDVDISRCLEKSEIVNNIIPCLNEKRYGDLAETSDKTIDCVVIESDSLSDQSSEVDDKNYEETKKRAHRRAQDPSRQKCNMSMWQSVEKSFVERLPPDINGLVAYRLSFDPKQRMQSSKDGRPWATWVTSKRKGFGGTRRTARCNGGHKCENMKCPFLTLYNKNNRLQFEADVDGTRLCSSCGVPATRVQCNAQKIWEFDESEKYVTVYHSGHHNCEAKKTVQLNKEGLKQKFQTNSKTTPKQAADDIIMDALLNEDKSWEDIQDVVDSVIEDEKVKNFKKKTEAGTHPHGHSFEAVGHLRSRLIAKDPFLIFKINSRNLNGEPSYVFKMSRIQAKLAVAMDQDGEDFLRDEYCYFDGTFKRCPGFITLGAHVYVEILRKVVKIATMECETESTETMIIFWNLLNEVLQTFTEKEGYKFNPKGWAVDEHGGNWAAIRAVYGESAVNEKTVSCEFHFKQSVVRRAKDLKSLKTQQKFKTLADKLMTSATPKFYNDAYNEMREFIESKPKKRGFLSSWLEWWNDRKGHFARAFKPVDAARVNMSEAYHSSYVTTGSTGLKLVDAAYKDITLALRLERSLELYGQGVKCQGVGPSGNKRRKRDHTEQSKRAKEYADILLEESESSDCDLSKPSTSKDRASKRKRSTASSSSSESEHERKKRRSTEGNERNGR